MKRCLAVAALIATLALCLLASTASAYNTTNRIFDCMIGQKNVSYWVAPVPGSYKPIIQYWNPTTRQMSPSTPTSIAVTTVPGQGFPVTAQGAKGWIVWSVGVSGPSYAKMTWEHCL